MKLDVVAYGDEAGVAAARQAFPASVRRYQGRFRLGGYKMFLDGSPQGRTRLAAAALSGGGGDRGYGRP